MIRKLKNTQHKQQENDLMPIPLYFTTIVFSMQDLEILHCQKDPRVDHATGH